MLTGHCAWESSHAMLRPRSSSCHVSTLRWYRQSDCRLTGLLWWSECEDRSQGHTSSSGRMWISSNRPSGLRTFRQCNCNVEKIKSDMLVCDSAHPYLKKKYAHQSQFELFPPIFWAKQLETNTFLAPQISAYTYFSPDFCNKKSSTSTNSKTTNFNFNNDGLGRPLSAGSTLRRCAKVLSCIAHFHEEYGSDRDLGLTVLVVYGGTRWVQGGPKKPAINRAVTP